MDISYSLSLRFYKVIRQSDNVPLSTLCQCSVISYALFWRIFGPQTNRIQGTGSKATEIKPRRLVAHAIPSRSYTAYVSGEVNRMEEARLTLDCKKWECSREYVPSETIRRDRRCPILGAVPVYKIHHGCNLKFVSRNSVA